MVPEDVLLELARPVIHHRSAEAKQVIVEVVDGLKPGEKIIVSGYEAFQKMDRVEFGRSDENP